MKPVIARTFAWTGVSLALLATFALYSRPAFLVRLADQVWSCF